MPLTIFEESVLNENGIGVDLLFMPLRVALDDYRVLVKYAKADSSICEMCYDDEAKRFVCCCKCDVPPFRDMHEQINELILAKCEF